MDVNKQKKTYIENIEKGEKKIHLYLLDYGENISKMKMRKLLSREQMIR